MSDRKSKLGLRDGVKRINKAHLTVEPTYQHKVHWTAKLIGLRHGVSGMARSEIGEEGG